MSETGGFRLYAMDADVHRAFDDAYRGIPFYLPSEPLLPTGVQGFSLCRGRSRTPVAAFSCFPFTRRRRWTRERVLRVARVLPAEPGRPLRPEAAAALLGEVRDIAARAGARAIEVEAYREIRGAIFFPSGTSAVNAYNDPALVPLLEGAGYRRVARRLCVEAPSGTFDPGPGDGAATLRFRDLEPAGGRDRALYYRLWTESGECPYDLVDNGLWYVNAFGWPRAWYEDLSPLLSLPGSILVAERDGEPVGFLHWWPNVYPLWAAGGRQALYLEGKEPHDLPGAVQGGKVFRLAVSRSAGRDRGRIERAMVLEGVRVMREKFGLGKVQVGNIPGEREELLAFLAAHGAGQVQELCILRKGAALFP